MMEIRVTVDATSFLSALNDPGVLREPLEKMVRKASFAVEAEAKSRAPVDTGRLRASISTEIAPLKATVAPKVSYALFLETGTRPHWAPAGALQPWARRHGFPAGASGDFLVRRAIAMKGTKAQPYMAPAAEHGREVLTDLLEDLTREIEARWGQHGS